MKNNNNSKTPVDSRKKDDSYNPKSFEEFFSFFEEDESKEGDLPVSDVNTPMRSRRYQSYTNKPKKKKTFHFQVRKPKGCAKGHKNVFKSMNSSKYGSKKSSKNKKKNYSLNGGRRMLRY